MGLLPIKQHYSIYLLNKAGEVAALSLSPSDDGFIVNTT